MRAHALFAILSLFSFVAAEDTGGWPDLFPTLENFQRKVNPPPPTKGEKPERYSQDARYEWLGGRFEVITIRFVRDRNLAGGYTPEAVKKTRPAPTRLTIHKKQAYLWDRGKPDEFDEVNRRLVVVLAEDRLIVVEQRGAGLDLADVAKAMNFEKVAKALESPPAPAKK